MEPPAHSKDRGRRRGALLCRHARDMGRFFNLAPRTKPNMAIEAIRSAPREKMGAHLAPERTRIIVNSDLL